jgi:hypothetical protein
VVVIAHDGFAFLHDIAGGRHHCVRLDDRFSQIFLWQLGMAGGERQTDAARIRRLGLAGDLDRMTAIGFPGGNAKF